MRGENLRKTLGVAAGGVAGAKVGNLAGAFVGAVAGLFTADAVNALRDLADAAQSRGENETDDQASEDELKFREIRGELRGAAEVSSLFAALRDVPGFMDAVGSADNFTRDQIRELLQENQEILCALFERQLRQQYAAINARWPYPARPLGLSHEEDTNLFEASLKRQLNDM